MPVFDSKPGHEQVEQVAEHDDVLMEEWMQTMEEGQQVSDQALIEALARCTRSGAVVPVLLGSSLHDNGGVEKLLDAVTMLLPSPSMREDPILKGQASKAVQPTCTALAFKV